MSSSLNELFNQKKRINFKLIFKLNFPQACASCSELPCHISTMGNIAYKSALMNMCHVLTDYPVHEYFMIKLLRVNKQCRYQFT